MSSSSKYSSYSLLLQFSQNQSRPSFSPSRRLRSMTSPIVFAPRIGIVRNARRQQEHLAFADRHFDRLSVFLDLHLYIALELVKKLFALVPVIILSRIRPADDHHDKIIRVVNALVPDRRLQQMPVLIDPFLEIEGADRYCLLLDKFQTDLQGHVHAS